MISEEDSEMFILTMESVVDKLRLKHGDEPVNAAKKVIFGMFMMAHSASPEGVHPGQVMTIALEIGNTINNYSDAHGKKMNAKKQNN